MSSKAKPKQDMTFLTKPVDFLRNRLLTDFKHNL